VGHATVRLLVAVGRVTMSCGSGCWDTAIPLCCRRRLHAGGTVVCGRCGPSVVDEEQEVGTLEAGCAQQRAGDAPKGSGDDRPAVDGVREGGGADPGESCEVLHVQSTRDDLAA
jgi:hypothetical protein